MARYLTETGLSHLIGKIKAALELKQNKLVAGKNISIDQETNVIAVSGKVDSATTADRLSTAPVGSTSKPVYINSQGKPAEVESPLDVSITGNAATATTATKIGNSQVGGPNQLVYVDAQGNIVAGLRIYVQPDEPTVKVKGDIWIKTRS